MVTSISDLYDLYRSHPRVSTDTRHIEPGSIFFALRGANFDGNRFAAEALEKGAAAAVIDDPAALSDPRMRLVDNTLTALQELARMHRRTLRIPILAITGSNGKTTTKELVSRVLAARFAVYATHGNLNNHIGVPLTLLAMDDTTQFGIVEMGASACGEIARLAEIAEPDYGIITNIGSAHLEGFGNQENIVRTKRALYEAVNARHGTLFVNGRDALLTAQTAELHPRLQARIVTYGTDSCFANGEIAQSVPFLVFTLKTSKGHLYVRTKLIGGYNFDNAMAATAVGLYFDIDPLDIQAAIEGYSPSNMRSQLLKTTRNTVILDAYNANPSSMAVAIENFGEIRHPRKIIIAGEMRELGADTANAHRKVLEQIKRLAIPQTFTVGKAFKAVAEDFPGVTRFEDTDALVCFLKQHPVSDAFLLVKGSRGNKLEQIIEYL